jgi:cytochrome b pre-mRNA-processing protein 3
LSQLIGLFKRVRPATPAQQLHARIVEQARQPAFYAALGVPDTLDGRFELIALHCFLVMRRLKVEAAGVVLAREVVEAMFADLDASLREMGAGDLGVGKRIKKMGQAFYGRVAAYDAAMADPAGLEAALLRNLYGTVPQHAEAEAAAVAGYILDCAAFLENQAISDIYKGILHFPQVRPGSSAAAGRH